MFRVYFQVNATATLPPFECSTAKGGMGGESEDTKTCLLPQGTISIPFNVTDLSWRTGNATLTRDVGPRVPYG